MFKTFRDKLTIVTRISYKRIAIDSSTSDEQRITSNEPRGMALIAALILLAILSIMGATVLTATSTEIAISGNYRRGIEAFYLAEAGIAEGRARLRGNVNSTPGIIHDPAMSYDSRWSAYILTSANWTRSQDPTYSRRYTSYVPLPGSQTNSAIMPNSLQTELSYWVKLTHKTEYQAEQDGHRPETPHYTDNDGSLRRHTRANPGNVIFYGYPTADSIMPMEFTTSSPGAAYLPVERIVSSVSLQGGSAMIEVDAVHPPAPNIVAALYGKNGVSLTEQLTRISGEDRCGVASPKAPTYTKSPEFPGNAGSFSGESLSPQEGELDIDLVRTMDSLKSGAVALTMNQENINWGSSAEPVTVYVDTATLPVVGTFSVRNMTGYGIVLVKGDIELNGPFHWQGLIISTGKLTFNGGTGTIKVEGGVLADHIQDLAGSIDITYDSCAIKTAVLSKPLIVTKWKQIL